MTGQDIGISNARSDGEAAYPLSPARRRYTILVLTVIYTLAFVDRQIVNILAEPIKQELHLADWQMGALAGFAFALLYTVLGLPIALFSERANRSQASSGKSVSPARTASGAMSGSFRSRS